MGRARDILGVVAAFVGLAVWQRVANTISVLMMVLAIVYVVAVAYFTVQWWGAGWLPLTMPVGVLLGYPAMKLMARFSERITN